MDIQEQWERLESAIREDERKKAAQELMKAHDSSGKALRPGLWYAATLLDPSLKDDQ